MEIEKIFNNDVDGIADNIFGTVNNSVSEVREMQKKKVAENVQLVIQALKKIETDIRDQFNGVSSTLEKRISTIKDGKNGINGRDGRDGKDGKPGKDGKDGRPGRDGMPGKPGMDGKDGVGVSKAYIDFDGSLIICLTDGQEINVGEVVAPDLAESIKVITNGGGTSQGVLDTLDSLQAQITALQTLGTVSYRGTWNASSNTPTLANGVGTKGYYYVVSVAGSTNIDGQTLWGVGDWIIFNGTSWQKVDGGSTGNLTDLTVSNSVTLSGGTANGVTYLNGSKVLTSGSALTFDGTTFQYTGAANFATSTGNVGIGTSSPAYKLDAFGTGQFRPTSNVNGNAAWFSIGSIQEASAFGVAVGLFVENSVTNAYAMTFGTKPNSATAITERMRLDSSGNLGIGTSSPNRQLTLTQSSEINSSSTVYHYFGPNGTNLQGFVGYNSNGNTDVGARSGYDISFKTAQSGAVAETMRLTAAGNLGLGVTPSAWNIGRAIQVGTSGDTALLGFSNASYLTANAYYNGGWYYTAAAYATRYEQNSGLHKWYTAASGSANAAISFTQAMTLDASGNLGIGTTSPSDSLSRVAATGPYRDIASGYGTVAITSTDSQAADKGGTILFQAAYTGTSTTGLAGIKGAKENSTDGNYAGYLSFWTRANGSANAERMRIDSSGNVGIGTTSVTAGAKVDIRGPLLVKETGGGDIFLRSSVDGGNTPAIQVSTNSPLSFYTNNTERARIDSSGNLLVGTTTAGASKLVVNSDSIQVNTSKTPASATATGTTGQIAWDANYIYVCTATNTWKRAALSTW